MNLTSRDRNTKNNSTDFIKMNSTMTNNEHLPLNNEAPVSVDQPKVHQQSQITGTFTIDHNHYYHQPYHVDVYNRPIQTTQLNSYNCVAEDSKIKMHRNYNLPNSSAMQQTQPCFHGSQSYPACYEQHRYESATQVWDVSQSYQNCNKEMLPNGLTSFGGTSKQNFSSSANYGYFTSF